MKYVIFAQAEIQAAAAEAIGARLSHISEGKRLQRRQAGRQVHVNHVVNRKFDCKARKRQPVNNNNNATVDTRNNKQKVP